MLKKEPINLDFYTIMEIETYLFYSYPKLCSVKFELNPITLSARVFRASDARI